jgi:hypothetical protein
MNKDLHDDMLKLVRYKILFVKREYEHAFPEREDLVAENMDGLAFTAWKVAEFIQELGRGDTPVPKRWQDKNYPAAEYVRDGRLLGLHEGDKKYLRVYYEVLERYPREKFKHEEQQIRVLEQIRNKLPKRGRAGNGSPGPSTHTGANTHSESPAKGDPYDELLNRLALSRDTFLIWRERFAQCARGLSDDIARAFNQYRQMGKLQAPEITAREIRAALRQTKQPFDRVSFDRFTGPALGDLRIYAPQAPPAPAIEVIAPPVHSVWGVTKAEQNGRFVQRITGSNKDYVSPEDSAKLKRYLSDVAVDLTLNEYSEELGIVSWASFYQNHSNQLRSIGYEMNGKLLWINQLLDPDMRPTLGPLALANIAGQQLVIVKDQFILSIDWAEVIDGKPCFCVYAMHINFNFEKCTAVFAGRILKLLNEVLAT